MTKAVEDLQEALEKHNERALAMRAARERLEILHTRVAYCTTCEQAGPCDVRLMLDAIDAQEDGITWQTNCTFCAGLWGQLYNESEKVNVLLKQMNRLGIKPDWKPS